MRRKREVADPLSRKEIRAFAKQLRKMLGLEGTLWIPVVELLDILADKLPGFNYEIVPDNELPDDTHACTDTSNGLIRIKESVYEGACDGKGRDRMTIAHEIAHFFLIRFCLRKQEWNLQRLLLEKSLT